MNYVALNRIDNYSLPLISGLGAKIELLIDSKPFSDACLIGANNDLQAVAIWLKQYSHKSATYLAYKKESDRFLLWCVYEVGKTLGQLQVEDFAKYIEFLQNPPEYWCTTVGAIRASGHGRDRWRPFLGPLCDSARNTAIRIINSLINYLVDASYLRANSLRLIKQRSKFNIGADDYKYSVWAKILDDQEWAALQQALEELPEGTLYEKGNKQRTQFIFACMYLLGLRISEVASSTWTAFRFHQGAWWFFVKGKGDKLGHIPVNEQLLKYVKSYRSYLGKTPLPNETETTYLIVSKKTSLPLSIKQIYNLIKLVAKNAARKFEQGSNSWQKLEKLSPHSLRHLAASHQDKLGIPMSIIQENLRHSSINTTKIYVHADDKVRHTEMEKMALDTTKVDTEPSAKELCLFITLSGSNVCTDYALEQFLYILESKILRGFKWRRANNVDVPSIIKEYENASKFGAGYQLAYLFESFNFNDTVILEKVETYIKREAAIRLLKASVKFGAR